MKKKKKRVFKSKCVEQPMLFFTLRIDINLSIQGDSTHILSKIMQEIKTKHTTTMRLIFNAGNPNPGEKNHNLTANKD